MKKRVIIVGCGASGMAAAISAARQGAQVTILEHQDKAGKKILMTGNGKCNLTNLSMDSSHYATFTKEEHKFVENILKEHTTEDVLDFFKSLSLQTMVLRDTYVYPQSEAATTVLSVLLRELKKYNISIHYGKHVISIDKTKKQELCLQTDTKEQYLCDSVILACGGKSYEKTGSDGSGFSLLNKLGIPCKKTFPALTAFLCKNPGQKTLSGLRTNATASLWYKDKDLIYSENGQIQFTDYGLSGIPVFQLSNRIEPYLDGLCKKDVKGNLSDFNITVDLFPQWELQTLKDVLSAQIHQYSGFLLEDALCGMLHKKWITYLLNKFHLSNQLAEQISEASLELLAKELKAVTFPIKDRKGFDFCQVTGGGVNLLDITSEFQLKKYQGIYVVGELLNLTGDCGGYNLHWAFISGLIAGCSAAK